MTHSLPPPEISYQAEAFLGYWHRSGLGLPQAFAFWARSKDFSPKDRRAIADEVRKFGRTPHA